MDMIACETLLISDNFFGSPILLFVMSKEATYRSLNTPSYFGQHAKRSFPEVMTTEMEGAKNFVATWRVYYNLKTKKDMDFLSFQFTPVLMSVNCSVLSD